MDFDPWPNQLIRGLAKFLTGGKRESLPAEPSITRSHFRDLSRFYYWVTGCFSKGRPTKKVGFLLAKGVPYFEKPPHKPCHDSTAQVSLGSVRSGAIFFREDGQTQLKFGFLDCCWVGSLDFNFLESQGVVHNTFCRGFSNQLIWVDEG